jgi:hypothetical protein
MQSSSMQTKRARPIPSTIGTIFGGLWGIVGALALPTAWHWPVAGITGMVTLTILLRLWRGPSPVSGAPLFRRQVYRWAVMFEVVAIAAASVLLRRAGLQSFFIQVVGIVVGLHFIGLYRATRAPRFLAMCAGMIAVSAAAMLLPAPAGGLAPRDVATGFGNALVLWIGVAALN